MTGEAALVLIATAATGSVLHAIPSGSARSAQAVLLVQLATAAGAAMVALQCGFLAQLLGDRRLRTVGIAWAFYGVVLMPLSVIDDDGTSMSVPLAIITLVGRLTFLTLLASGLRPAALHGRLTALRLGGLAVGGTALLSACAMLLPAPVMEALATPASDGGVLIGWTLLAGGFAARGIALGEPVWWRLGLGIAVEAAARFDQLASMGTTSGESLRFVALRLLGFVVLVVGLGLGVNRATRRLRAQDAEEQERAAAEWRSRASRDHEIRNALSNLAAITVLAEANRPEPGDVAATVTGELARLRDLLEDRADRRGRRTAPVDLVLRRLVLLRSAAGCMITLDCPAELNAAFPTDVLTEVLTNLLANCERHAPGADVRIVARRVKDRCRIDVTDTGPGLAAADAGRTTGSGIGLALSSQLMINNGGALRLLPHTEPTGCTARLELPLAADRPLAGPRAVRNTAPRHLAGPVPQDHTERSA